MPLTFQEPHSYGCSDGVALLVRRCNEMITYVRRMGLWWRPTRCARPEADSPLPLKAAFSLPLPTTVPPPPPRPQQ